MKELKLTPAEQETLKGFRVCFKNGKDDDLSIEVNELFDKHTLEDYIDKLQKELQAPNRRVTASLFSKRYAFLHVAAPLYSFSVLNKIIDVSGDNLFIKSSKSSENWLPEIYLENQKVLSPSTIEERKQCREELLKKIFNNLNTLWNNLASVGKISKQILWENTSIYIFWLYETLLVETESAEIINRIKDDFHFILFKAEGTLFGDYQNNPLTKFYHQKSLINGEAVRVRKTCCFSFELDKEATMCKTCPRKC